MNVSKRIISVLMVAVLMFSLYIPTSAENSDAVIKREGTSTWVNPAYQKHSTEIEKKLGGRKHYFYAPEYEYYTSTREAGHAITDNMANREEIIHVGLSLDADKLMREGILTADGLDEEWQDAVFEEIYYAGCEHTGNGKEGDAIYWCTGGYSVGYGYRVEDGRFILECDYEFAYYTDADDEAELDEAIEDVIEELDLSDDDSNYEKATAIYNYICDNVEYDYYNLYRDPDYLPMYTAHAALIDGTAVCQGYSVLFYRLALEMGVDARFIGGYTDDGEPHAWNIVKLGDEYYNLDSTWDAGCEESEYEYYLRGSDFFDEEHLRDPEYVTDQFYSEYPVPKYDFDVSTYEPGDEHRHYFYLDAAAEAGCTMDGAEIYKCICGETEPVVIASDGHIDDNSDNYCEVCGGNIGVADEFPVIITGETKELDIEKGKFTHISFTPSVSGIYSLSFSSDEGVYGFLYDDEGAWINYDSGKNITIKAFMYAGKTYCLGVLLHGGKEGEASVSVLCDEENPDVTCPTTTEPTTTEPVTTEKPSEPDATVNDINPGETLSYDFDSLEDAVSLKFIPSVSGTYTFYSTSESDLVGGIVAEDMETVIGANDDVDYEGGEYDFSVSCYLEAGKLYYLCAFFTEYEDEAGPFTVTLIMGDAPIAPENDIEVGESLRFDDVGLFGNVFLSFTPTVSGTYTFYSTSDKDLRGSIFASDQVTVLAQNDDIDLYGGEYDFSVTYYLEAGEQYYLYADFSEYEEEAGPFTVTLIMGDSPFVPENGIEVGESLTFDDVGLFGNVFLSFTPTVSGTYTFYSTSDKDLRGSIFASDQYTVLAQNDDIDYPYDCNFSVSYYLEAGTTYYLYADFSEWEEEAGPFTVTLIMGDAPEETTTRPTTTRPTTTRPTTTRPTTTKPNTTRPTTTVPTTVPTTKAPQQTGKPIRQPGSVTTVPAITMPVKTEKATKPAKVKVKKPKSTKAKKMVVTWNKVKNASGYQVAYSTSKKFKKKDTKTKIIKKAKTAKTTVKKLKSGKKYFVRVRAFKTVGGKKVYGAWSKIMNVKVK